MVAAARRGMALRQVARRFGVALATVRLWVARAEGSRLDRVDFAAKPPGRPRPVNRSSQELEDLVLTLRLELKDRSDLGEFGARAIRDALKAKGIAPLPSARTIGRILERRGALAARSHGRGPWTAASAPDGPPLRPAGTCPTSRPGGPNWTAPTSSRAWSSR